MQWRFPAFPQHCSTTFLQYGIQSLHTHCLPEQLSEASRRTRTNSDVSQTMLPIDCINNKGTCFALISGTVLLSTKSNDPPKILQRTRKQSLSHKLLSCKLKMNSFEDPFGTTPLVKDCNCTLKEKKPCDVNTERGGKRLTWGRRELWEPQLHNHWCNHLPCNKLLKKTKKKKKSRMETRLELPEGEDVADQP